MSEQAFKNVTVLKGIPVDEFMDTMGFISAATNYNCIDCHVEPKAEGAWLLHQATKEMKLDCFVMFSSVSSIFGNPAQGNYSAANAFLDSLAWHRQALGLPALTVNWGVLGGQGYVARNQRVSEFLARQGREGGIHSRTQRPVDCESDGGKPARHF